MEDIQIVHVWFLLAGLVGAFGNQVVYWGNRVRRSDTSINRRMFPISVAYVGTGGAVGFFVGVESGLYLLSLGSGAFWPETLKALDAARSVSTIIKRRLQGEDDDSGSSSEAPGG